MSHRQHKRAAVERGPVPAAVLTVSDTRDEQTDESGAYLRGAIGEAGHRLTGYRLVPDEPEQVIAAVEALIDEGARCVLVTGGTGISRRDRTYDALAPRLDKTITGFGELFRSLSFAEIGAAAMLSRAIAGTLQGALVFAMPGSQDAVRLAWTRLIEPEISHLDWEMTR